MDGTRAAEPIPPIKRDTNKSIRSSASAAEKLERENKLSPRTIKGFRPYLSAKLPAWVKKRYPHITYKIQQNESAQLCKMVKERVIELAIVRFPLELDDFSVMQANPLILPSTEGLGVYHMIVEEFSRRKLEVNLLSECSDIPMLLELVSSGFAATIVPEVVLKMHKGHELKATRIDDTHLSAASGIIWLKDHYLSMAARHFIEQIRQ